MANIHDYDDIRPFLPEELPAVFDRLISDPEFKAAIETVYKGVPYEHVAQMIRNSKDSNEFQVTCIAPVLENLIKNASTGLTSDFSAIKGDKSRAYTFVSNHRDIVLDSALLCYALLAEEMSTVEIAIGDNLLIRPWIKDLVRVNKSFIVQRALTMRQMLMASAKMSSYMHFAINEKKENIWIAQREGRAKDSDDRTQESVLKMMVMGGEGSIIERLKSLNIVPLAISYEYDPCDYLKAMEFQNKRDIEGFKKSKQDDLDNMKIGIFGYKGHIHYHAAPCINDWLDSLDPETPKTDIFRIVAEHIDQEIHSNYRLYPCNLAAADTLANGTKHEEFEVYIGKKLSLVTLDNPDTAYLREQILKMYANPAINKAKADAQK